MSEQEKKERPTESVEGLSTTLGQLKSKFEQLKPLLSQMHDLSARGQSVVMVAYLDQELANLLRAFLIDDRKLADALTTGFGPLATFHARIETACALGLISERERHNLNMIRQIRTEFAHGPDVELSFETPEIEKRCMELQPPREVGSLFRFRRDKPDGVFMGTCSFLLLGLMIRRQNIRRQVRPEPITEDQIQALI